MASKPNPFKKMKVDPKAAEEALKTFLNSIESQRQKAGSSVKEFKFNQSRVRLVSKAKEPPKWTKSILYWMTRDQRVHDNWSLLYAQKIALQHKVPLLVCFAVRTKFLGATIRHYRFMLRGLHEVATLCSELNIPFHLITGNGIQELIDTQKVGGIVIDFSPLRGPLDWIDGLKKGLLEPIPVWQVDAHNIVPCWVASDKLEYAAKTIRNKINNKLDEYLTQFPCVIKHPYSFEPPQKMPEWNFDEDMLDVDKSITEVSWATPGYTAGMKMLHEFCERRLKKFHSKRNDPNGDALSNLSPWFHFGQISVQQCILVVRNYKSSCKESVDSFCEEAIVRRELADNFCYYNKNYDKLEGAYDWARKTLNDHRNDKREYVYTKEELEGSKTHDDLWNSAQIQLVKEGKMHGYLRMYWAKKILEWTPSPEVALETAIWLNDRYSMDGRDPNGYVGCMWSICGIHDQGWKERNIFGKIRYMNYDGCKRKFDVAGYVARYGGKVYRKKK